MSVKSWNTYIKRANRDLNLCQGSDFLTINGHYWDWKEFNANTVPMRGSSVVTFKIREIVSTVKWEGVISAISFIEMPLALFVSMILSRHIDIKVLSYNKYVDLI